MCYYIVISKISLNYIVNNGFDCLYLYSKKVSAKQLRAYGEKWTQVMFMVLHARWVLITTSLAFLMINSLYFSLFIVVRIVLHDISYTATYYVNWFSVNYDKMVKEKEGVEIIKRVDSEGEETTSGEDTNVKKKDC
jgi:hypothetical protein